MHWKRIRKSINAIFKERWKNGEKIWINKYNFKTLINDSNKSIHFFEMLNNCGYYQLNDLKKKCIISIIKRSIWHYW